MSRTEETSEEQQGVISSFTIHSHHATNFQLGLIIKYYIIQAILQKTVFLKLSL